MQFESRITWEKLCLELDLLSSEAPNSIAPLLLGFNAVLWPGEPYDDSDYRRLGFMGYELTSRCTDLSESERLQTLNKYFFEEQGYQIKDVDAEALTEDDFLLKPTLGGRTGHALTISLLYLHFAAQLDLPVYLIDLPQRFVLKWVRSGKASFIDLSEGGKLLSEMELVQLANKALCRVNPGETTASCFDVIPAKKIVLLYAEELIQIYERKRKTEQLHTCLNIALKLEPSHLGHLRRRALLCRELGLHKEALSDIKRYFSFANRNQAPTDIKMAYFELQSLSEGNPTPSEWLH